MLVNTEMKEPEIKYPCLMEGRVTGKIVLMTAPNRGVIVTGDELGQYWEGREMRYFKPLHPNTQIILSNGEINTNEITKECNFGYDKTIKDKDLVWCWDNDDTHMKYLKFYNEAGRRSYTSEGRRLGKTFHQYEKFIGEYPDWALSALKTLE
jgi:hypothetical protein